MKPMYAFFVVLCMSAPWIAEARVAPPGCRLRPEPAVRGERSRLSPDERPRRATFSVRNPGRAEMHMLLDALAMTAPVHTNLEIERMIILPDGRMHGPLHDFGVYPRSVARLEVQFTGIPMNERADRFEITATFRREQCPYIARARLDRPTR